MKAHHLFLAFFLAQCLNANSQVQERRPNVVIVVTDDQGWGDLSVHGNKNLRTPNIDRLAKEGVRFRNFYVSPVCSPTRAELLTGRYHPRGGVRHTSGGGERLDVDETTLADAFKTAGYVTALYGKWHSGGQYPYHPNARGFDDFYGFCSGHWGDYFSPPLERNGELTRGNGFLADDLTDNALKYIEDNKDTSFFLVLAYNTPHSPMQVPDRFWQGFREKKLEMFAAPDEDMNFTRAALAMCENIDWNVGRVLKKLEEARVEEETIVVYLSDNGPNSARWNGGLKGKKGSTDEGGIRSPLFIRWPGNIPASKEVTAIASVIDLFPTLTKLAGIEGGSKFPLDGIDLTPLMQQENPPWSDRMIFSHWNGHVSVRTQRYRLDHLGLLYDMQNDMAQTTDISRQQPVVTETLQHAVQNWKAEVLSELGAVDDRPFVVGHPEAVFTHMPAGEARPHGNIKRSSRYPNCSFMTNWLSKNDSISWQVEVPASGEFEVTVYYTCAAQDVGSTLQLKYGHEQISEVLSEAFDPPLKGMQNDRVPRIESYVKEFRPLSLGVIRLEKGKGLLVLKAGEVPGSRVMDFQQLSLKRVSGASLID